MNAAERQKWRDALPVVQRIAAALGDVDGGASGLCNACRYADWSDGDEGPRCEHPKYLRLDGEHEMAVWAGADCKKFWPVCLPLQGWVRMQRDQLASEAGDRATAGYLATAEAIIREAGL